ncbi:DNA-directed RNA polymerase subunit beta' [candidate division WOR-3 bacterium RBG_13_43_14]|uniref:DNA-directed RNA polymerase subunit beta' n=1 Tax=candidate division WOR-3 bacterium RBG_13_43_14 TaxID=1802590 RepID=A0A1F4UG55_UNCW3|nr:MAG: DNA-directed RNA polymerase subunit beta' [candidate division WOR-3 bacterium RBG_13_43_14]
MRRRAYESLDLTDYDGIRLSLASPEVIANWSHGEITRADTINYRTQRPEKDGLFCERIFGPIKDFECSCGKYKKAKYRGTICDRCGVEVAAASVRRDRMGHVDLAVPIAHVFYYKIPPSKIGLLLELSINQLEAILNYEVYIVLESGDSPHRKGSVLLEEENQEAKEKYTGFKADMGGQPIYDLLKEIDLENLSSDLRIRLEKETLKARRFQLLKKLKLVEAFRLSGNRPEWMVMTRLPVIPPDLRPLVALEGGRYATSDLNDLYKRVITRNNRVKSITSGIKTPEVIVRNEKRMLQDSVDALLDNTRRSRPIKGRGNRPLRSLADALKGKQGRFRRNLLGKRVDYSGRSVIVVDPSLKLYECGIPKEMALELFKPMIVRKLEEQGVVDSERSARRLVRARSTEVYEILEEIIKDRPVLLNRAPTLHRVSIQAFLPVLREGRAITIHPLVCHAFNADFDGDTMSIHIPLSPEAIIESYLLLLSIHNIRSPAHGRALMAPSQDMVIGLYYLTKEETSLPKTNRVLSSADEAHLAIEQEYMRLNEPVKYRYGNKTYDTTPGRVIFNEILPEEMRFKNTLVNKRNLTGLIDECLNKFGTERTVALLDDLKEQGFEYATRCGLTIGIDDMISPRNKDKIWARGTREVYDINKAQKSGLISETERYNKIIDTWTRISIEIEDNLLNELEKDNNGFNPLFMMVHSGARGSRNQACQICGLRGLMSKPQRKVTSVQIIETPIKSSCKEGLSVLEYFISTHGARKGLADTALKTADAGYLTRRLVDAAQNVTITMEDCGTIMGQEISALKEGEKIVEPLNERIAGRVALVDTIDPLTDEAIIKAGTEISNEQALHIEKSGVEKAKVRSILTCEAPIGLCAKCYGRNLATGKLVEIGEAVGIIAAQSIGEPGTQLTLRTFHGGGVALRIAESTYKNTDITGEVSFDNLNAVENSDGHLVSVNDKSRMIIKGESGRRITYNIPLGAVIYPKRKAIVQQDDILFEWDPYSIPIVSPANGMVKFTDIIPGITVQENWVDERSGGKQFVIVEDRLRHHHPKIHIFGSDKKVQKTFSIPAGAYLLVKNGDQIKSGTLIARIPKEIGKSKDITGGLPRVEELFEAKIVKNPAIVTEIDGIVDVEEEKGIWKIMVTPEVGDARAYRLPTTRYLKVHSGEYMRAGDPLCEGAIDPHDILRIKGPMETQRFLVNEILEVYRIQDVKIDDKHIEIIVRQMLQRVKIEEPGNTPFVGGEIVDKRRVIEINQQALVEGRKPATYRPILLGITRAALSTQSFFSASSFQETTKVLADAAVEGKLDRLEGLKENVIVGRIIPAGTGLAEFQKLSLFEDETEAKAM